jgi:hypothetical protein
VQASESFCKRRKKSTSTARSVSTYRDDRRGRCVPRTRSENVVKDDKYSHQKMRIEHAQDRNPSDKCEATVEVLALELQQRDDMPQMKIVPRLKEAEEGRLKCDQSSNSPTYHNEHTPKVANNNTGSIPVQSHDSLHARPVSKKTVVTLDDISEHKIPEASLSVREKSPKTSKSKNEMTKKDVVLSSITTKATSLPGIKSFQPDVLMGQKRKHDIQGRLSGVSLRELHERSLQPRFT